MRSSKKTPTIQDVARFAGVSTATVSRALSNPERVSVATRARVSEAVRVTGYTLNQTARSLRQRSAKTILVALPDIRNSFFSTILDAIEREVTSRGYGMLVANLHFGHQTRRLQDYLLSNRADGLILLDGSLSADDLQTIISAPYSVPLVVGCEEILKSGLPTVVTDNEDAAAHATQHLIDFGHRRIGHIFGPENNVVARDRHAGFVRALTRAGLPVVPEWIFKGSFEMDSGFAAAARFMTLAERPTAVFAANDESAIGFLSGLRRHGILCPRDISVIGFDDLAFAPHFSPPLSTMRQPRETLGKMAASALIDILEGEETKGTQLRIVLRSELIVRESTAGVTQSKND